MHFIDSHAHLTADSLYEQVEEILKNAAKAQVQAFINICTDETTLRRGIEFKKRFPNIYLAAAVHPHDADDSNDFYDFVVNESKAGTLVGIGETGLDYFYEHSQKTSQKGSLKRHLKLALEVHLPIIIHCRDAFSDFFSLLDENYTVNAKHAPGVLHCFTGNMEDAKNVLERGWYISLSGIVTFKKSTDLQEIAKIIPLDQLQIETDSPYLAPQSKRGKSNQPAYLPEIAQCIADIKGLPIEAIAEATQKNAKKLFNLKHD